MTLGGGAGVSATTKRRRRLSGLVEIVEQWTKETKDDEGDEKSGSNHPGH